MKNQQRFAEIEFCLDKYFKANLAPVMQRIQTDLQNKQMKERMDFDRSFAGMMMHANDSMYPGMNTAETHLKATGKWNSKTVEDYMAMCQKGIANDKTIQKDLERLSAEWRNAVIGEIGRARYDQLSKKIGGDLAYSYIDYRVQQMMVQRLVDKDTPKSTAEYIIKKAAGGSLIGVAQNMQKSPLAHEISARAEKAYNPSAAEKATARGVTIGVDVLSTGCIGSWGAVGKFAATEVVFDGIEFVADAYHNKKNPKAQTVEECISQAVFGSDKNVFPSLRKQGSNIKTWENTYVKGVDATLGKKMGIATTNPKSFDMAHTESPFKPTNIPFSIPESRDKSKEQQALRQKHNIPMVVAPGMEEEYIKSQEAKARSKEHQSIRKEQPNQGISQEQEKAEPVQTPPQSPDQSIPQSSEAEGAKVQNPVQDNQSGWNGILNSLGFNGLGDIGHNLGYVISMLPDILVGMWTGKTKSLDLRDNLVPYASVLAGMFVKNPILKMLLIGMGGANLLNKAGHEALANADGQHPEQAKPQYLRYADQPLNPRISDVVINGTTMIATIDKVPCAIRLTQDVVNAYNEGALPLNTLANTILERSEQRNVLAQDNYDRIQQQAQERERNVAIK